jgi:hypothetical protein
MVKATEGFYEGMGHRNISTTIGYVDASDDMLRKAVDLD